MFTGTFVKFCIIEMLFLDDQCQNLARLSADWLKSMLSLSLIPGCAYVRKRGRVLDIPVLQ